MLVIALYMDGLCVSRVQFMGLFFCLAADGGVYLVVLQDH